MKVKISYGDQEGEVIYNKNTKEVSVDFPDESLASDIEEYLQTKRVFRIPESDDIDDYREDFAFPFENIIYFELAMSNLYTNLDVWVNW